MKELEVKRPSVATILARFSYGQDRSHGNHRTLTDIDTFYFECSSIYHLTARTILATGPIRRAADVRFVEIMGGSSYRAGLTEEEITTWFHDFAGQLKLVCAVMVAHRRTTGRFDFHILSPAVDREGRSLITRECRSWVRAAATEATEKLNLLRLDQGRFVIANIRRRDYVSQVYYLKREEIPALETERSAPSAPSQVKPEATAVPDPSGDRRAQGVPSGESPATANLTLRDSHALAKEEPRSSRGAADGKPSGKAESASKPSGLQGLRLPGGSTTSAEDEEEKRRKKERLEKECRERDRREQERLRQLQELRDRCDARELLIYLESLNRSGAGDSKRPPEPWLEFAERARLYVPDPSVRFSARQFIEDVLPKLVFAMVDLDGGVPRGQRDLMARCLKVRDAILEPPEVRRASRDREL